MRARRCAPTSAPDPGGSGRLGSNGSAGPWRRLIGPGRRKIQKIRSCISSRFPWAECLPFVIPPFEPGQALREQEARGEGIETLRGDDLKPMLSRKFRCLTVTVGSSKKVGMCSCPPQDQVPSTNFVDENPVRANVRVPRVRKFSRQPMRTGVSRQRLIGGQRLDTCFELLRIPAPFFYLPVIFEKTVGIGNLPHGYLPELRVSMSANISLTEPNRRRCSGDSSRAATV